MRRGRCGCGEMREMVDCSYTSYHAYWRVCVGRHTYLYFWWVGGEKVGWRMMEMEEAKVVCRHRCVTVEDEGGVFVEDIWRGEVLKE